MPQYILWLADADRMKAMGTQRRQRSWPAWMIGNDLLEQDTGI